jgi:hypothetical protein
MMKKPLMKTFHAKGAENKYREEPDPPKFVFDLLRAARAK